MVFDSSFLSYDYVRDDLFGFSFMEVTQGKQPVLPRRAFVAAGLSAILAGSAVALAMIGGASETERDMFRFSRGLSFANGDEARLRGFLSRALSDERLHVTILGHTGSEGDATANLQLSEERAALAHAMAVELGLARDRITSLGVGGGSPLPREDGESDRAYQSRLARVEVSLQMHR